MTMLEGGIRDRLIRDAMYRTVRHILDSMGWLDLSDRREPVMLLPRPTDADKEVKPNRVSITAEDVPSDGVEMGSTLGEYVHLYYVDIYAEKDEIGVHIAGDIRAGLEGKLSAAGRTWPILPVHAPGDDPDVDVAAFTCSIDNVLLERVPRESPQPWEKHWFSVRCELTEEH